MSLEYSDGFAVDVWVPQTNYVICCTSNQQIEMLTVIKTVHTLQKSPQV